jgi:rhodanese-related sulfurtransferase
MDRGQDGFVVIDTRSREDFEACHIAGAISVPHRSMNEETIAH